MLTNRLGLPKPFVDAAKRTREVRRDSYSCTTLLKGTCETVLTRRHSDEIVEDVSDKIWSIFGTAVHKILEESQETEDQIKEATVFTAIDGCTITGRFDLYDASTETVTDYKTTSVFKYKKGDFEDYRKQLLIYCCLLTVNGFAANNGEVILILRDWIQSKAKTEKDYPDCQVQKITFNFTESDLIDIAHFMREKITALKEAQTVPDDELIPCNEHERWHTNDMWAVVKDGKKKAYRLFDSEEQANIVVDVFKEQGKNYHVEYRPGTDAKCEGYCAVRKWCPLWKDLKDD